MNLDTTELDALEEKYAVLIRLRRTRAEAVARGRERFSGEERAARRREMASLAARFPGALRELDACSEEQLSARAEGLREVRRGGAVPDWLAAIVLFHRAMGEALALRRGERRAGGFWSDGADAAALNRPPGGRAVQVVWAAVAARLGTTPRAAERLAFPCEVEGEPG